MVALLLLLITVIPQCLGETEEGRANIKAAGCFDESYEFRDFSYNVTDLVQPMTAMSCIHVCLKQFFRYAAYMESEACFCSSSYGMYSPRSCSNQCNISSQGLLCINNYTNAVFDTGQRRSGPPPFLKVLNVTETSIEVMWGTPEASNEEITGYRVVADCVHTYSTAMLLTQREWKIPSLTLKTDLVDLQPGTQYNVSVAAENKYGAGVAVAQLVWTQIGEPEEPEVPKILRHDKGQIVIELRPATNNNGPITAYRIVVLYEDAGHNIRKEMLKSYEEAQREGLAYYIAAELSPEDLKDEFVVGDGRRYQKYFNPPLPLNRITDVTLGIVSSLNNITKVTYAQIDHDGHSVLILNVTDNMQDMVGSSGMIIGLSVAIGICAFLLVCSVVAYCMLRRYVGRRRHNTDHQELSLQGPMIEVEPNGYIHNGYIPEEEEERVNHYEKLKQQVWNIPRNFLDVKTELLGQGRYGNVVRGTVLQRGFPIPVAIHTIADDELLPDEKRQMLKDLGTLIQLGMHANVASLVGTCENPDTLFVVLEHHPASLKDILLESRCLEHSESRYDQRKICSLTESQVLETAIGIARAMDYLTSKKIVHSELAARNVVMADGVVPKVASCGISRYNKHKENPDYTRWTAQEVFRGRSAVSKSDVWSFGCVMWEISAIGGTPYVEVATSEVPARVMRGLRLPQFQYVGDDLYQLMLQCWQMDLDERPTFQEMSRILENMLQDSTIHLNFDIFTGFHYESYLLELELLQP